jgi:hypothetical protein
VNGGELYKVFRNPLVHWAESRAGATVWRGRQMVPHRQDISSIPGPSPQENERTIEDYCNTILSGETLIALETLSSTVHTRPLYWCTRKMIEAFTADPAVDIATSLKPDLARAADGNSFHAPQVARAGGELSRTLHCAHSPAEVS